MKYSNKIYTLSDPITNIPFYIGKTDLSLKTRLKGHIYVALNKKESNRNNIILKILKSGLEPKIEAIEEEERLFCRGEGELWLSKERYWISQFVCWGFDLCNIIHNPVIFTKEFRSKHFSPVRNKNRTPRTN